MNDCIFCKIVNSEIPSFKIYEDATHLAFLDINPNTKGVTLVIPKKHNDSNPLKIDEVTYTETLGVAREVSKKLAEKLNVARVGMAIEGMGVNHFHIKLYPFYLSREATNNLPVSDDRIYNKTYPGYLTTQLGPQADFKELENLAKELI